MNNNIKKSHTVGEFLFDTMTQRKCPICSYPMESLKKVVVCFNCKLCFIHDGTIYARTLQGKAIILSENVS